jgi:hypothetical protein
MARRVLGTVVVAAVLAALAVVYVLDYLVDTPAAISAVVRGGTAHLTLQTVPSFGHAPDPDWVSYLAQDSSGHWQHTTIYKVPAHTLVTVTIYNFDGASGLRNPFMSQVRGTRGGNAGIDGKAFTVLDPDDASHTFTIPDIGLSVPLKGVGDDAPNQCSVAPCPLSQAHTTITFTFMSPGKGTYRWQCFVPCAAGFIYGFGGPMQTIGWMSGEIEVT